jgi:hypothetical protein
LINSNNGYSGGVISDISHTKLVHTKVIISDHVATNFTEEVQEHTQLEK